jgi:hypothetical protein
VRIYQDTSDGWEYPAEVAQALGWEKALQVRALPKKDAASQ